MNDTRGSSRHPSLTERLLADPWHFVERAVAIMRARASLSRANLGSGVGVSGKIDARISGPCEIAMRVSFRGGMIPTLVHVHPGGSLTIGERTVFNYGVLLDVRDSVRIGARCMLASMVRICDADGDREGPVVIGNDVWIAHGALVQPGVTIGDGAVVSAGSVVTSDVPAGHLAIGNPARVAPLQLVSRERTRADDIRLAE